MHVRPPSSWSRRPRRTDPVLLAVLSSFVLVHALASTDPHVPGWWGGFLAEVLVAFTLFGASLRWEWALALPPGPSEEELEREVAEGLSRLEEHLRRSA